MKATGIVREIDDTGRYVIPKEIRDLLGIKIRDKIEVFTGENDTIILKKYVAADTGKCSLCGSTDDLVKWNDKCICKKCFEGFAKNVNE